MTITVCQMKIYFKKSGKCLILTMPTYLNSWNMTNLTSISCEQRNNGLQFQIRMKYRKKPKNETSDYFLVNKTVFESPEAASEAAAIRCMQWGSNLRYLGPEPVRIDGKVYYENFFNVWD